MGKNLEKWCTLERAQNNKPKAPELRFPSFTDDWEQRKVEELCTNMSAGGDVDKSKLTEKGRYPVIANALTNDGVIGFYEDEYRIKAPAVTVTGRGDVGHAKARKVDFTPVVRLLTLETKHDVDFLENAINNITIVNEFTGVPQLTVPQLSKYLISVPPTIEEEIKIGDCFVQIDNLITLHQRKLDSIKELKKGLLQKTFSKDGCKVSDKNLEKWCTLERAQNNKVYPKGTIYTALSASNGIAYQLQEDGYISDRYAVFIPKTKYINVFYEIFCENFEPFYQRYNQGINFAFNNFKFFDFSEITLSDKELQEMEEVLKEINNLIDNERLFIQQMKGFKDFCLDKMFC